MRKIFNREVRDGMQLRAAAKSADDVVGEAVIPRIRCTGVIGVYGSGAWQSGAVRTLGSLNAIVVAQDLVTARGDQITWIGRGRT